MTSNSYPSRKSLRLNDYDYSQEGAYFVTIVTEGRASFFGSVISDRVALNEAGEMIQSVWSNLPQYSDGLELDQFVVMPNHVHGILTFARSEGSTLGSVEIDSRRSRQALFAVVHRFKSFTTHEYGNGVTQRGWPKYAGKLWQRDYYEHVIRNDRELAALREYIANNPLQWQLDHENPFREG